MAVTDFMSRALRLRHVLDDLWPAVTPSELRDYYFEYEDFEKFDADDDWVVTNFTAGTADIVDGLGGILELDSASSTADQGVQVQHKTETFLPQAGSNMLFECRCKVTDTIAGIQFFAGLSVLDTTLFSAGENSSIDHIGIEANATTQAATSGRVDLVSEKGGARATTATVHTLIEDTYVLLGFFVEGVSSVTPLVNGVPGTPITTGSANTPVTELAVTFQCIEEGGSVDPILSIDWYYCIQTR